MRRCLGARTFYLIQNISIRARSIRIASADGGFPSSFAFFWADLEYHTVGAARFVSRADSHNGCWLEPVVILGVGLKKVF